jgi:alkylated DNA repair protein (DNA oxidative demethylase)
MVVPGGWKMSVALTNCGEVGWVTDRTGYRYDAIDPETGRPWPPMPQAFADLAAEAAQAANFIDFRPDACLVNRSAPGARLSLHQDRNERDFDQPIVSVSLACRRSFSAAAKRGATEPGAFHCFKATSWSGAALIASRSMASIR